jgi:predicted oxidoreductase
VGVSETPERDLIIVGAGAAGIAAAIEAARRGLKPLVLEVFPQYGGAAATSGGGCCIPGTPLQASLGLQDSPELALRDWLAWGGDLVDAEWARFYLEHACQDLFHWAQDLGVVWIGLHAEEGNSVNRWHLPKGTGQGLMRALYTSAQRMPIEWCFSTEVTSLLVEDGRVGGVEARPEGGSPFTLRARAVVVATGGFCNNAEMLANLVPDPGPGSRLLCGGARQAVGRGHRLLEAVGAHFTCLDQVWMYVYATPDYLDPTGRRGLVIRGIKHDIWLNAQGRRFHREDESGGATGTRAVWAQTPRTCWAVFDRDDADRISPSDPYYRRDGETLRDRAEALLAGSPFVWHADTPEALAAAAGLPPAEVADTVRRWNGWIGDGLAADPEYGRPLAGLRPLQRPPFYAVQFFPLARKNFGGARTDLGCRVLRPDGSTIPGLYAAGEVAGMAGGHINGRAGLEGTMLGPSLFSGGVAGRTVADDVAAAGRRDEAAS